MKLVIASLTFIIVSIGFLSDAMSSLVQDKEIVRVRLLRIDQKQLQISGTGLQFQNLEKSFKPVAIPQKASAQIRLQEKEGKSFWTLSLSPDTPEHIFTNPYLLVRGQGIQIGTHTLPSKVLLSFADSEEGIDVVGVMPLDEYIVGVLASEMPLSWPLETLKAQAVAARSYALAVMKEKKDRPYHLESSILDQVFRHIVKDDENDPLIKKALQAVRETKGQRLWSDQNNILKAFYHSDCGGKTTTAKSVWSYGVNAGVAVDSSCPTSPKAHWSLRVPKADLLKRLKVSEIKALELLKKPQDERVSEIKVAAGEGLEMTFSANEFRQKVGFQDLKSALFDVREESDAFVFQGRGFGHGVGLCQWGSRALGKQGKDYKQILKHYYPLAQLR